MDLGIPGLEEASVIGRGGFAVVYRAFQPAFRRAVAVKVLTLAELDEAGRNRFERECQAMGLLSEHPGIVTVHEAGFTGENRPYLVMAYVSGGTLADRIEGPSPESWRDALTIGVRLSGALETAHRAQIIHRDVKPANVLRSQYGAQLSDFGIARIAGGPETRSGVITASIAHAAPEILDGERPTVASDVYSLGSTLYTLLAGKPAFVKGTDESILPLMLRIHTDPVPDLTDLGVPAPVAVTLEQAMSKDPEDRHRSALHFGRALQGVQDELGCPLSELIIDPGDRADQLEPEDTTEPETPPTVPPPPPIPEEATAPTVHIEDQTSPPTPPSETIPTEPTPTGEQTSDPEPTTTPTAEDDQTPTSPPPPAPPAKSPTKSPTPTPSARQHTPPPGPTQPPAKRRWPIPTALLTVLMAIVIFAIAQLGGSETPLTTIPETTNDSAPETSDDTAPETTSPPTTQAPMEVGPLGAVIVPDGNPVQIRSFQTASGEVASVGIPNQRAANLAVEDFGPIKGHDVDLLELDDLCSTEGGQAAAEATVSNDQVVGVIGTSCSSAAVAAAPLLSDAGMVMISPSNTKPKLTSDLTGSPGPDYHPGYYRTAHNDNSNGQAVAQFVLNALGSPQAAVIHSGDDPYSQGLAETFINAYLQLGGEITVVSSVNRGDTEMTPVLNEVASGEPGAIFMPLFQPQADLVVQGIQGVPGSEEIRLIGTETLLVPGFLGLPESRDMFFSRPNTRFNSNRNEITGVSVDELLNRYQTRFGEPPSGVFWAHSYDATTMLLSAITDIAVEMEDGGLFIDRQALRDRLTNTAFAGMIGEVRCDEFGDCGSQAIQVVQHDDGSVTDPAQLPVVFEFSGLHETLEPVQTVGSRLSLFEETAPAPGEAFHVAHGFDYEPGLAPWDFVLYVDGVQVPNDGVLVMRQEDGVLNVRRVYNFPDGMIGEVTFEGRWYQSCSFPTSQCDPEAPRGSQDEVLVRERTVDFGS